ncbi:unnamed protein product, partial [Gulo gulo]
NWSRCVGFRWEVPTSPHLTTLLCSGSTRPEVWKSASESVMQLVPGHRHSGKIAGPWETVVHSWKIAGPWETVVHSCQHER